MFPSVKMVASELLMCGLKNLPFVGTAVEVIEGVRSRHEMLIHADRLAAAEDRLSRMERGLRDLVEKETRTAIDTLSRPNLDGPTLTQEIRNIQEIRAQGWEPTLFEGLLRNSSHWHELRRHPHQYGRVLSSAEKVERDNIHVLIDADSTRILELAPYAFSQLLSGQSIGSPKAEIVSAQDVWAVQTTSPLSATRPAGEGDTAIDQLLRRVDITRKRLGSSAKKDGWPICYSCGAGSGPQVTSGAIFHTCHGPGCPSKGETICRECLAKVGAEWRPGSA
jgi:hypothetical protein